MTYMPLLIKMENPSTRLAPLDKEGRKARSLRQPSDPSFSGRFVVGNNRQFFN
jgi:hypothetical protein